MGVFVDTVAVGLLARVSKRYENSPVSFEKNLYEYVHTGRKWFRERRGQKRSLSQACYNARTTDEVGNFLSKLVVSKFRTRQFIPLTMYQVSASSNARMSFFCRRRT